MRRGAAIAASSLRRIQPPVARHGRPSIYPRTDPAFVVFPEIPASRKELGRERPSLFVRRTSSHNVRSLHRFEGETSGRHLPAEAQTRGPRNETWCTWLPHHPAERTSRQFSTAEKTGHYGPISPAVAGDDGVKLIHILFSISFNYFLFSALNYIHLPPLLPTLPSLPPLPLSPSSPLSSLPPFSSSPATARGPSSNTTKARRRRKAGFLCAP